MRTYCRSHWIKPLDLGLLVGIRRNLRIVVGLFQRACPESCLHGGAGFFIIGAQYVLNNFAAASYETNFRATGVGMLLSVGRVGAILGPFVVGTLQQVYTGPTAMFIAIGGAAIVAALAIASVRSAGHPAFDLVASRAVVHG